MSLNNTPSANRLHVALFGRRNSGKSSLINALTGQDTALVSDIPGTTTDTVSKAMEIQGIGPCLFIDTPGFDDEGELGEMRIIRTLKAIERTDIALLLCEDEAHEEEKKWMKQLEQPGVSQKTLDETLEELHKSFAFLSQEEQKFANLFLHDVQTGDVKLQMGYTLQDYIVMYSNNEKKEQVRRLCKYLGCYEDKVFEMLNKNITKENINEYGRFDALKATVVKEKAQKYFSALDGKEVPIFRVGNLVNSVLSQFLLEGGRDIPEPENWDEESIKK